MDELALSIEKRMLIVGLPGAFTREDVEVPSLLFSLTQILGKEAVSWRNINCNCSHPSVDGRIIHGRLGFSAQP
jgi:hypothetical protein